MAPTEPRYNGWKNRQTWNVALWLSNDEGLYRLAKEHHSYAELIETLREGGVTETPDQVAYNDSGLDITALDELLAELEGGTMTDWQIEEPALSGEEKPMPRIELIQVLCLLGTLFHSGPASRGYRLQCACRRWLARANARPLEYELLLNEEQQVLYEELSMRYYHAL